MLSNMMKDIDKSYWEFGAARKKAKEIAGNLLKAGIPVDVIAETTKLPEKVIREL